MTLQKIHQNLVPPLVQSLKDIFNTNQYADKVVERVLKSNKKWGSRDRKFISQVIYDCVRWKRRYIYLADLDEDKLLKTESIKSILLVYFILNDYAVDNLDLKNTFNKLSLEKKNQNIENRAIRESIPDWLDSLAESSLGSLWADELNVLNQQAEVVIRANTLKINLLELKKALYEEGVETTEIPQYPSALILNKRQNLTHLKVYKQGFFEIQDASSQLIAPFLQVKSRDKVIDACAGAGGKTLHLAALMKNKGEILSMDVYPEKLKILKHRADRNGVNIVTTKLIESSQDLASLVNSADKVLIDAPCSGLGVLRRNPDAKWKLTLEFIYQINKTQLQILIDYSKFVKVGGSIVYATCSILPLENEDVVNYFLKENRNYILVKEQRVLPSKTGYDGFYMALIKRIS